MSDHIQVEQLGAIQLIRMNRPEKKNALTTDMYLRMAGAINSAQSNPKFRVSIITGAGDCFTAGNDLADFNLGPKSEAGDAAGKQDNFIPPFQQFVRALLAADKPVIAAVNGLAVGIGVTMLLHCDLVYAADTARFSLPFVNLGAVPEAGSSLLMPRIMGRVRANELLLFGEPFSAEVAQQDGLINQIFPAAELMQNVIRLAEKLAAKPPSALRASKRLLRQHAPDLMDALREEGKVFSTQLRTPEAKEALKAFTERRPADFSSFE